MALLTIGIILFLVIPLLRGEMALLQQSDDEPTDIEARKRVALKGLRDVEYDYQSGKLDEYDYLALKSEMSRDALAAMEEVKAQDNRIANSHMSDEDILPDDVVSNFDSLEEEVSRARRGLTMDLMCLQCAQVNVERSSFCVGCGHSLLDSSPKSHYGLES